VSSSPAPSDRDAHVAAQPHELCLAWAFNDPGVVHLARYDSDETLCGSPALDVSVGRRSVTCVACKEQTL